MKKTALAVFSLCLIRATPYAIGKIKANGKMQGGLGSDEVRLTNEEINIVKIPMTQTAAVSNPIATGIFGFILPLSK
jgi:hypothetical protein